MDVWKHEVIIVLHCNLFKNITAVKVSIWIWTSPIKCFNKHQMAAPAGVCKNGLHMSGPIIHVCRVESRSSCKTQFPFFSSSYFYHLKCTKYCKNKLTFGKYAGSLHKCALMMEKILVSYFYVSIFNDFTKHISHQDPFSTWKIHICAIINVSYYLPYQASQSATFYFNSSSSQMKVLCTFQIQMLMIIHLHMSNCKFYWSNLYIYYNNRILSVTTIGQICIFSIITRH